MKKYTWKTISKFLSWTLLTTLLAVNASALDIKEAKEQGLVGETTTGYIEALKPNNKDVSILVMEVNKQRKSVYEKIASDNGISLQAVELRAAEKAYQKTPAGQYIKLNGEWKKK